MDTSKHPAQDLSDEIFSIAALHLTWGTLFFKTLAVVLGLAIVLAAAAGMDWFAFSEKFAVDPATGAQLTEAMLKPVAWTVFVVCAYAVIATLLNSGHQLARLAAGVVYVLLVFILWHMLASVFSGWALAALASVNTGGLGESLEVPLWQVNAFVACLTLLWTSPALLLLVMERLLFKVIALWGMRREVLDARAIRHDWHEWTVEQAKAATMRAKLENPTWQNALARQLCRQALTLRETQLLVTADGLLRTVDGYGANNQEKRHAVRLLGQIKATLDSLKNLKGDDHEKGGDDE